MKSQVMLINSEPEKYKMMVTETKKKLMEDSKQSNAYLIKISSELLSYQSVTCMKRNMIKDSALKCYEICMHCGSKEV